MNQYKFLPNIIPVEGYKNIAFYDLQNERYELFSKKEILTSNKNIYDVSTYNSSIIPILIEKRIISMNYCGDYEIRSTFSSVSDYQIESAIIYISKQNELHLVENIEKLLSQLSDLLCKHLLIKICYKITIKELQRIINFVNDECFFSVQLFLEYDNNYYSDSFCELIVYNHKIQYCIVNNSPESQSIEGKVYFIKKNFSDFSGGVSPNNFVVNIKFFSEAKIANPFFYKKISIMSDGSIKNTPSSPTIYGNIKNDNLKDIMRSKEIEFFWYSKKDQIEGCKDCEFRYMCPDDRVPSYKGNDQWFQKIKCNYNPYLSKWN